MKRIPYIADVDWVGLDGTILKNGNEPVTKSQYSFFVERLNDQQFTKHKDPGIDALTFAVTTKIDLENQRDTAKERGYWLLEDDKADSLKRACLTPSEAYNNYVAIPVLKFLATVKEMTDHK